MKCPLCRECISPKNIHNCISHKLSKKFADKMTLMMEIRILPHKWFQKDTWTKTMTKHFRRSFPRENPANKYELEYMMFYLN